MNLWCRFEAQARAQAGKTAIFWAQQEFPYGAVLHAAEQLAGRLNSELGVQPGDRVALWMKNQPEFVPCLFAILRAGGVVVPINNFLKPDEVNFIVADSGADVLITDAELAIHEATLIQARPDLKVVRADGVFYSAGGVGTAAAAPDRSESDLAVLIYTSGTTGRPKGAMLSHGNLLHNVESCRLILEATDGDRMAVLLPLFHSYMLTVGLLMPLLSGGTMVLVKSLSPLKALLEELLSREPTILPGFPQFYRTLVASPLQGPLPIRVFISGSAPLPVQVLRDFEEKFHTPLLEGYGLSEASPVVSKNPLRGVRKAGSIGLPLPNVEMSVQDDQGRTLAPGEVGEICVRGGNVMMGYWNQPGETAKALRNGWLLTGDIGYRDAEGYYYITDRKKDMLLVNGNNVYPREIEEAIYKFKGVKEAAVIGVPDPRRGERPLAYVAAADGEALDTAELARFLRKRLADYKQPREIRVVEALPRNATGKILKTRLREQVEGESGQQRAGGRGQN
ncbi:MAG: long-chain fatty acid--CoA ligase [Verrucomicrobia bacterium]|jgi:long-chain acyl-CoA synthetase|nr:long-chain fatty acid--CoA ligase [Verrucomicrobiota bacterium]